jgi:tetratricopeptide (TPR) repeat protein
VDNSLDDSLDYDWSVDQEPNTESPEPEIEPVTVSPEHSETAPTQEPEPFTTPIANEAAVSEKKPPADSTETITAPDRNSSDKAVASALSRARNQDKATARSLFAAKTRGNPSPGRRYLLLAGASLLPLSLVVIWLSAQLDLFGTSNQYYVDVPLQSPPEAAMDLQATNGLAGIDEASLEQAASISQSSGQEMPASDIELATVTEAVAMAVPGIEETTAQSVSMPTEDNMVAAEGTSDTVEQALTDTNSPAAVLDTTVSASSTTVPLIEQSGPESPIQITRSTTISSPDMQMMSAWAAYQQGNFSSARDAYREYLIRNPDNRDALLGLAASAMQVNDIQLARQAYARLLVLNPRDPLARTGLLDTTAYSDPIQRESELKSLRNDHPDIAGISYSLGTLYAEQQRWREAQEAFYDALLLARTQGTGPVSPDYAFSLAVALERINQPLAALSFYREAQALAQLSPAGFDPQVLAQRLRTLEGMQP